MVDYIKLNQVLKKKTSYLILKKKNKVISNTKEIKMNHKNAPSKGRKRKKNNEQMRHVETR